jgi:hypothetical protein
MIDRIKWFPLIMLATWIFPVIHRLLITSLQRLLQLLNAVLRLTDYSGHSNYSISIIACVSIKFQGFLDGLAYGLTPAVVSRWKGLLCGRGVSFKLGERLLGGVEFPRSSALSRNTETSVVDGCMPDSNTSFDELPSGHRFSSGTDRITGVSTYSGAAEIL